MINNIPAGTIPNLLSLLSQTGKAAPSLAGTIVQAISIGVLWVVLEGTGFAFSRNRQIT